jgi:long-chain acyl-CoA synthetase
VVHQGYGLTEASPIVTHDGHRLAARRARDRSAYRCPASTCAWSTGTARTCCSEDPGEIQWQGPNVFRGYWEDAEATARALTETGWLRTGDVAVVEENGDLLPSIERRIS